jgi:ATP-dependent 26S proteasome regulatory subunit
MTTNHPEKLDEALLRMGRIDLIIQIDFPTKDNIKSFVTKAIITPELVPIIPLYK